MNSTKEQTSLGRPPLSLGSLLQIPNFIPPNLVVLQGSHLEGCYSKAVLGPEGSDSPGGLVAAIWFYQVYCIRGSQVMPTEV